jgi:hypothetical protein
MYHGVFNESLSYDEDDSGHSMIKVNHFRNLLQHLMTMTVNQRPAFEPKATNTDHRSQAQVILSRGLLDYYMREKSLEVQLKDAVEYALLMGEGYLLTEWDANSGEDYASDPETNQVVKTGDINYTTILPVDVVRDIYLQKAEHSSWYIVRRLLNKYDLAARFPEHADDLISTKIDMVQREQLFTSTIGKGDDTDLVPFYTFYHDRTPACPNGRMIEYIDTNLIMSDATLPYEDLPVKRVSAGEQIGTPFGYTVMFDLLSPCDTINGLYSIIKTNQETFGVQNIAVPKGSGISFTTFGDGMNIIEYDKDSGAPQPLNLTQTPVEVFNFLQGMEKLAETLSGVNSVARGDPQASLKSGAALALVQSQAVQFSQPLQNSYTRLLEGVGQLTINMLRTFGSVPRIAMIVGKNNRGEMKEFTGEDLSMINRVTVDQGNPMTRTTAGKVELAQMLMQMKMIDTPEQLLQVIQTGNLEALTEGKTAELMAIKSENEAMADGEQVPVMVTDDHATHIREHKSIISDPVARKNPQIVQTVTDHLMQHLQMLQDPNLAPMLQLLGQQPMAPQGMPPAGQAGPGGMQSIPMDANSMAGSMQPNQPQMPKDAMTGKRYTPPTGQ